MEQANIDKFSYEKKELILIGCGGHARSIIDILCLNGEYRIKGLIGKEEEVGKEILGFPVIGTETELPKIRESVSNAVIAIGQIKNPNKRKILFDKLKSFSFEFPKIISKNSYVSSFASIGVGTTVGHQVIINSGARIGANCILNSKSLIEHDCIIGNFCHISTGTLLNGGVTIGDDTFIGSGSIIREGINLPKGTIISAGQRIMGWPLNGEFDL